jgi:hypothetical protein
MLDTPADELIVEIQRVDHESRVGLGIESDNIPAEVARLEKVGAKVVRRLRRWVGYGGAHRSTFLRRIGAA